MMKIVKRLLAGLLVLVVLVIAVAGVVLMTLDLNSYKPQIEQQVLEQTGRKLSLKGDIGFSLFPSIALELGEASLGNAPGFGDEPFASIGQVSLKVALLPLLRQRLEVDTVVFDDMSLNLAKHADGRTNWDDLASKQDAGDEARQVADQEDEAVTGGGAPPLDIQVQGLQITNARLDYRDASTGQHIRLDPFNLRAGELSFGQPMPLEMDLHLYEGKSTELKARLTAMITVDPEPQQYRLDNLKLQASVVSPDAPGGQVDAEVQASLVADLKADTAAISDLVIQALGLRVNGQLQAQDITASPGFSGTVSLAEFNPRAVMKGLGIAVPQTADPGVLSSMQASMEVNGTDDSVKIAGLNMKLDDSTLKGTASVRQFSKPVIRVDLGLDAIDLDRYMAPETDKPSGAGDAQQAQGTSAGDDQLDLPVDMIREQDAVASFSIGDLTVQKAKLTDATVKVTAREGVVLVKPFGARMYGGGFDSTMKMDVSKKTPKFTVSQKLSGVESGPLLKDMFGDNYLSGKANFSLDVQTAGDRVSQLKKALSGGFEMAFTDGSVNDSELAAKVDQVVALLEKRQPGSDGSRATHFSSLTATAKISQGVINNQDLHLKAPKFQIRGLGTANLVNEKIDYQLRLMKPGAVDERTYAPIDVSGSFSDPAYRFNEKEYLKQIAEREKQKVEKKAKDKIEKELNKALEGLFK